MVSFLGRTEIREVRCRVTTQHYSNHRCACAPRVITICVKLVRISQWWLHSSTIILLVCNDIIGRIREGRSLGWVWVIRGRMCSGSGWRWWWLTHYLIHGHISTGTLVMGHHSIGCISGSGNTLTPHFTSFSHSSVGDQYVGTDVNQGYSQRAHNFAWRKKKMRESVLGVCIVLLAW